MRIVLSVLLLSGMAFGQAWSGILDASRAIDWTSAGFTIPSYTVNCATQPSLLTGAINAATNTTAIQNALSSCDATHNVVNIPSGTYYVDGITYPSHGKQLIRGAGPTLTTLISTTTLASCVGLPATICMIDAAPVYNGSAEVLPPSGTQQCLWSAGYSQGTTSITLSSCGGVPPNGGLLILDQARDSSDTGGVYICDETTPASCNYDGTGGGVGRTISGLIHSQTQVVQVTNVSALGGGSYTVTISPGVYFTNVRTGQAPGAWWPTITQSNGLENLTVDGTNSNYYILSMYDCYHCWAKNVVFKNPSRAAVGIRQAGFNVVRDSYFYQAQAHASISYNIELNFTSGNLIENNIMQQVTNPVTINNGTGNVIAYNFGVDPIAFAGYTWGAFASHAGGNQFNLWEGNVWPLTETDDAWGSTAQQTYFRNLLAGWQSGGTQGSTPIINRTYNRAFNFIGNVLGQPGYHTQYQIYATGTTTFTESSLQNESKSIYSLGLSFDTACGTGTTNSSPFCDSLTYSTVMRWGNYDVVNAATRWDSAEASPSAVTYLAANFTSGYFGGLAHTLPNSLYYSAKPSWWGAQAWPPIGPGVATGNIGRCSGGTYDGAQSTSAGKCTGGTLATAWGSLVNAIPAQDCYLNTMNGVPDGTGSVLAFDASVCYAAVASYLKTHGGGRTLGGGHSVN